MRREELYLRDILEAADDVAMFLSGIPREEFLQNNLVRSAVLQKLMVIGEAAAHIDDALRGKYPQVPWQRIVSFRNYAIHEYFGVNWGYAWIAATQDTPHLREKVLAVLQAEFGG
jgi:uncharacterized protein with HEPN domain